MCKSDHDSYHASINNSSKWSSKNQAWIDSFKKNHAAWCRDNAPTRRHDVTFSRILEVCERAGFRIKNVADALDVSQQLINERLVANGFSSFEKFREAYQSGMTSSLIEGKPGLLTRDLSFNMIKCSIEESDTKRSLAIKLGCTVNVLDKFLSRRLRKSWKDLRSDFGFMSSNGHDSGGRPRGVYSKNADVTIQVIYDAYSPGSTLPGLADKLGITKGTVLSRINAAGYSKYSDWTSSYQNHKIVSIDYAGTFPLYDLTVDGYKNFAIKIVLLSDQDYIVPHVNNMRAIALSA
jgi:hypothetical protein